jgi:hypothetical protein
MKTSILSLIAFLTVATLAAPAYSEHSINLGFFTEHIKADDPRYNENNNLVQYMYTKGPALYTFATFKNSHFIDSHMIGAGHRWKLGKHVSLYAILGAVEGYQTVMETTTGDYIIIPILGVKVGLVRFTMLGSAVNAGLEYEF